MTARIFDSLLRMPISLRLLLLNVKRDRYTHQNSEVVQFAEEKNCDPLHVQGTGIFCLSDGVALTARFSFKKVIFCFFFSRVPLWASLHWSKVCCGVPFVLTLLRIMLLFLMFWYAQTIRCRQRLWASVPFRYLLFPLNFAQFPAINLNIWNYFQCVEDSLRRLRTLKRSSLLERPWIWAFSFTLLS